jgi:hypothetical protein
MSMEAAPELDHSDRLTLLPTTAADSTLSPGSVLPALRLIRNDAIIPSSDAFDIGGPMAWSEPPFLSHSGDLCSSDGCSQPNSPAIFSDVDDQASSQASLRSWSSDSDHVLASVLSWDHLQHTTAPIDMGAPGVVVSGQSWCSSADLQSTYPVVPENEYPSLHMPQDENHPYLHTSTPTPWTSNSYSFEVVHQPFASTMPSTTQSHSYAFPGKPTEEGRPCAPLSLTTSEGCEFDCYPPLGHDREAISKRSVTSDGTNSIEDCALPSTTDFRNIRLQSEMPTALGMTPAGNQVPYAQWLYMAFISHPRNAMTLQEIYQWFRENTDKDKKGTKGWQNSIRHNLSMNGVSCGRHFRPDLRQCLLRPPLTACF